MAEAEVRAEPAARGTVPNWSVRLRALFQQRLDQLEISSQHGGVERGVSGFGRIRIGAARQQ